MKHAISVFLFSLSFTSAKATIVRIEDLSQMAQNSDVIAHVVVGEKVQNIDEHGRSVELSVVEVIEGIKGLETGGLAIIYQLGGDVPGQALHIVGQSRFDVGEELMLFGMKQDDKILAYGVGLGKFKVLRKGDHTKVVEDFHDLLAITKDKFGSHLRPPIPRQYASLERFKDAIYQTLNAPWHVIPTGPKALRMKR